MAENKKYWRGLAELENPEITDKLGANEFSEDLPTSEFLEDKEKLNNSSTTRRDFLKYMGFSTAAATIAACESPVYESLPYVVAPEEVIPGIANYYATTYFDGYDFSSVLIKTREGRPIKVENNKLAKVNGGASTRVHASVLNLYDATRLQKPMANGKETTWQSLDKAVTEAFAQSDQTGKQIVMLTSTVMSPTTKKLISTLAKKYTKFKHVEADAISYSAKLDAIQAATGKRALPTYDFSKASVIVSFNADFLGDWTGQRVNGDYAKRRVPGKDMSRHIQFESNLSLTGSNADKRYKVTQTQMGKELLALHNAIASAKGLSTLPGGKSAYGKEIDQVAQDLIKAGQNALVLNGTNNADCEQVVIAINKMLGNEGTTFSYGNRAYFRNGNDAQVKALVADMAAGKVGTLLVNNLNPAYSLPASMGFAKAMKKVDTTIAISQKLNETASLCNYVAAENNPLESWGDYQPVDAYYTLQQPVIQKLFNTRQLEECLMAWAHESGSYQSYLKENWNTGILGSKLWSEALHDGVFASENKPMAMADGIESDFPSATSAQEPMSGAIADLNEAAKRLQGAKDAPFELNFYAKVGMGAGVLANNPWLQEFPDPLTRVSWDNYLTISKVDALAMGLDNTMESNGSINGMYVRLKANGQQLEKVPVLIQPGQTKGTVGLAVGYGQTGAGKVADGVGVNAFTLMNGSHSAPVEIEVMKDAGEHGFASVQLAHTMMGRNIVKETDLQTFLSGPAQAENGEGWNQKPEFETYNGPMDAGDANLWDDFDHETGHMWNMSIDLNLCNGCGACVIACHSENNVPVVGKEEVRKHRDMHWLRIDRYYSSATTKETAEAEDQGAIDMYADMEEPSANPDVFFQPVMCQHCNHAPCETVCPVAATTHSQEGLNHMTYNRCIGTRYCANNCPYKVRRFNWFLYHDNPGRFDKNYSMNDDLGRMVLNPDVTVRSRGVMEKCSMCIQRIQLGKLEAKKNGTSLKDGQIKTACQSACDTNAIVFGDVNNKESQVFKMKQDKRMYHLLEEVGTQPSVFYQVKVRNNNA
jgi:molybdopterin-containing oxidoreductase family iron-sulfur binding subunit